MHHLEERHPFLPVVRRDGKISSDGMRFQWQIPDFYKKLEKSTFDYINSPSFWYEDIKWYLAIRVRDKYDAEPMKNVSLYICGENKNYGENVDIALGFCTIDGKEGKALKSKVCFGTDEFYWGPFQFSVELNKIAPSGTINVFCYLKKNEDEESTDEENTESELSTDDEEELKSIQAECCTSLYKDMGKLFLDVTLCDVNLILGEECYKAHSSVLSCRSPVFYEMLKDHPESLHLEQYDLDVFEIFLEFLYVGRIEDPSLTNALKLYRQAHLYEVSLLKKQCLDVLQRYLSVDTICHVVRLAKEHCVTELYEMSTEFFLKNYSEILDREEWIQFLNDDPLLANAFLKKISLNIRNPLNTTTLHIQ